MGDSHPSPSKRQMTEGTTQQNKRRKSPRNTRSLPPSQERLISTFFPSIAGPNANQDLIRNREACEKALDSTVQIRTGDIASSSTVSHRDNTSISSSQQASFTSSIPPETNADQEEEETPMQSEGLDQTHEQRQECWTEARDIKNLVKLIKTQVEGINKYITKAPTKDTRQDEILALNKTVSNLEIIASALKSKQTGKIKLEVIMDTLKEQQNIQSNKEVQGTERREKIFEAARVSIIDHNKPQAGSHESTTSEGEIPPYMVKKMTELIEERLKKAKLESSLEKRTREVTSRTETQRKENSIRMASPPPPSDEMKQICLGKAREYKQKLEDSNFKPTKPSALWLTSFDNRKMTKIIDEANFTTLPGKTTHGPAWDGALATKISFRSEKHAINAETIFRRNIKNLPDGIKDIIHIGLPSYGAWKLFEIRTEFIKADTWESMMNVSNLNEPKAIAKLIKDLCEWNKGALWEGDIQKAHITHDKDDPNMAALILRVGPLTFDYYKILKKEKTAFLNIKDETIQLIPIYTPYCCWGCFQFSHLKNECPNATQWTPNFKEDKPFCGLCDSKGLRNTKHKAAMRGCPVFETWATNLEEKCLYHQGGY